MTALQVAGLQIDIAWEDPDENLRRAEALAARACASGARLLVLPEMFATGFSMYADRMAAHGDRIREFLQGLAQTHGVWVLGGFVEAGDEPTSRPYNCCVLFRPRGDEALKYRKIHPFSMADEHLHYGAGEALPTAMVEGVRVTPLICYDLRFPEPFRAAAEETDLFVVAANWPDPRIEAWSTLLKARAIENLAYVLGINRVGTAGDLHHSGRSALIDPEGKTLAFSAHHSTVLGGPVDPERVSQTRQRFGFLCDRRPRVYAKLGERKGG